MAVITSNTGRLTKSSGRTSGCDAWRSPPRLAWETTNLTAPDSLGLWRASQRASRGIFWADTVVALEHVDVLLLNAAWNHIGVPGMFWDARELCQEAILASQLDWLDRELSSRDDPRPAIVVIHAPLAALPPGLTGAREPLHVPAISYRRPIERVLNRHPRVKLVLAGHNHATCATVRRGRVHLSTSSIIEPPFEFRLVRVGPRLLTVDTVPAIPMPRGGMYRADKAWVNGRPSDRAVRLEWQPRPGPGLILANHPAAPSLRVDVPNHQTLHPVHKVQSAMNSTSPWSIRAVQLDLARQRETIPAIGQFIRFAKDWGFNTLVLYLEGRVRTRSFPYRSKHQSYAPDDMRRIVEMAARAGVDVVPCVNTLFYVKPFTTCRPLAHLAEHPQLAPHLFCPSNPRVYEFLQRYLSEVAVLFPSRHFHIGCDEAFELGTCPVCRPKSREELLLTHIRRVRDILRMHGKRVWIWDDMFENASRTKLAELPRDVVLCAWNYLSELMDEDGLQGHFNNLARRDWLAVYEQLGFDVLICPRANDVENTLAFTRLARRRRVLGGLQTNWELSTAFLPSVLPASALAGALWSQPHRRPEEVLANTLRRLFPSLDPIERAVVRANVIRPLWEAGATVPYHLRGGLTLEEARHLPSQVASERILNRALRRLRSGQERDILEELHAQVRLQILAGRQRETLPRVIDPRTDRSRAPGDWCVRELKSLARLRAHQWRRYRRGIRPERASAHLRQRANELRAFLRAAGKANALLQVRLFLWESYSAPRLTIELRARGRQWREVYGGTFKPVNLRDAPYTLQVPVRWPGRAPDRIRFTVSGFGGQGLRYAVLHFAGRSLGPARVARHRGRVVNPRATLNDDATVCFLGSTDTVRTLRQHRQGEQSVVELVLAATRIESRDRRPRQKKPE